MSHPTAKEYISYERACVLFTYDPQSGVMRWAKRVANCIRVGDVAGWPNKQGYLKVKCDGKTISIHRLAWLLSHKRWPEHEVDHIDCNKTNNRLANLRDVDQSMNQQNRRTAKKDSATGLLGAHPHGMKFIAAITLNRRRQHIGIFDTAAEAHHAYVEYKRVHHAGSTL